MHIKGFSFTKKSRAFAQIYASDCDQIYGDTYKIKDRNVEEIGNNVTLEFGQMDFGDEGTTKLVVYGRSPLEKNTIHLRFTDDEGESSQIIEFLHSKEYEKQVFELEKIKGRKKVSFIFLPGSKFDFGWFRFERKEG